MDYGKLVSCIHPVNLSESPGSSTFRVVTFTEIASIYEMTLGSSKTSFSYLSSLLHLHIATATSRKIAASAGDEYDEDDISELKDTIAAYESLLLALPHLFSLQRPGTPRLSPFITTTCLPITSSLTLPPIASQEWLTWEESPCNHPGKSDPRSTMIHQHPLHRRP